MDIQEKIIREYPLANKIDCGLECYAIPQKEKTSWFSRLFKNDYLDFVVFWEELVEKSAVEQSVLRVVEQKMNGLIDPTFGTAKNVYVIGYTKDKYSDSDLLWYNGTDTMVFLYLMNEELGKIYVPSNLWGGRPKIVKQIDRIVKAK